MLFNKNSFYSASLLLPINLILFLLLPKFRNENFYYLFIQRNSARQNLENITFLSAYTSNKTNPSLICAPESTIRQCFENELSGCIIKIRWITKTFSRKIVSIRGSSLRADALVLLPVLLLTLAIAVVDFVTPAATAWCPNLATVAALGALVSLRLLDLFALIESSQFFDPMHHPQAEFWREVVFDWAKARQSDRRHFRFFSFLLVLVRLLVVVQPQEVLGCDAVVRLGDLSGICFAGTDVRLVSGNHFSGIWAWTKRDKFY